MKRNNKKLIFRIFFSLILLFSILFLPFWFSIILGFFGIFYFSFFVEAVILMFLSDLLYGIQKEKFLNMYFISFLFFFLIIFVIEFIKKKIKFYPN